ncbi:hypothetical protein BX600DRAFT_429356 [Xylariales sp. PMI_506]|nr:hypothetical protein BX600DRAFT_429356 [Xylariales sp. PMI_506]
MATIKAIEAQTIHQIQSGQVIVDLCSVVKELVENSVDAGATNIVTHIEPLEVRFKNQGLDSVEVQDNGGGISPHNYETLALKHYTSKLSTYEDLSSLQTFGFRGEALSSLCALSKFSVVTCMASDAPKGSRLEFETSGKLRSTSVVAAQKGTTVTVDGLFYNLPVRRRELERNIKREWNKVITILNQYACILTGVKFSVSQQPNKGRKIVLFATKGNQTTKDNIVNVFGAKTLTVLIVLELDLELEPTSAPGKRWSASANGTTKEVRIRGHVSRPAHGEGRQTPDRQMFFVNGRPCGLPQFAKVFNEVYKSYNSSQSPFIFADIQLDTDMYDVNVSPDKRTILLHDQTRLLDNLRESLVKLFEAQDYSVPISQLGGLKQPSHKKQPIRRPNPGESDIMESRNPLPALGYAGSASAISPAQNHEQDGSYSAESPRGGEEPEAANANANNPSVQEDKVYNRLSQWVERGQEVSKREKPNPGAMSTPRTSKSREIGSEDSTSNQFPSPRGLKELDSDDQSLTTVSQKSQQQEDDVPTRAGDFNAHLARLNQARQTSEGGDIEMDESEAAEAPIPSIPTPTRGSEIRNIVSPPSRLKRTAPGVATIIIGGDAVTSRIGSPEKRQRKDQTQQRIASDKSNTLKGRTTLPSFQGRLTQMFSASSSSRQISDDIEQEVSELAKQRTRSRSSSESSASSNGLFVDNHQDQENKTTSLSLTGDNSSTADLVPNATHSLSPNNGEDVAMSDSSDDSPHLQNEEEEEEEVVEEEGGEGEEGGEDDEYIEATEPKAKDGKRDQDKADGEDAGMHTEMSEEIQKRQQSFVKGSTKRKDTTGQLLQRIHLDEQYLKRAVAISGYAPPNMSAGDDANPAGSGVDAADAEEKLSLTISKADFGRMKIIGQFNLGFILAMRASKGEVDDVEVQHALDDELFIIDQHATDEKYNFERLQATTVVQSQRLVHPKTLELTALEEEVIKENIEALESNGFMVTIDESGYHPVGSRCQLLSLPLSRETTFSLADLEELISLLAEHQSTSENTIPRPSKVRKMFAMRACRSSVMIGKSLTTKQMEKLVRHMGELDKPWNCPHGRPTMRHLCGLGAWQDSLWQETDSIDGTRGSSTDWTAYLQQRREEE